MALIKASRYVIAPIDPQKYQRGGGGVAIALFTRLKKL
jgi:hypothetical protein